MLSNRELVEQLRSKAAFSEDIGDDYVAITPVQARELSERLEAANDEVDGLRRQSSDQANEAIAWRKRAEAAEARIAELEVMLANLKDPPKCQEGC